MDTTGLVRLSPREIEIGKLLTVAHASDKEIAQGLGISQYTVHSHLRRMSAKVGVSARSRLALWLVQHPEALRGEPTVRGIHRPNPDCLCQFCLTFVS